MFGTFGFTKNAGECTWMLLFSRYPVNNRVANARGNIHGGVDVGVNVPQVVHIQNLAVRTRRTSDSGQPPSS